MPPSTEGPWGLGTDLTRRNPMTEGPWGLPFGPSGTEGTDRRSCADPKGVTSGVLVPGPVTSGEVAFAPF